VGDLKLYNTRTRTLETFTPLRENRVGVYVCGLTPSAEAHLGHARSFLFFDVLRRYLQHRGYDVTYVQNVTDIDDRSINRARETGEDWYEIVSGYYGSFKASMRKLGVREPDVEPYATKYVPEIQVMIRELLGLSHAYVTQDGIYYRVSSFPEYGALSRRNIGELEAGARIEVDEHKEDPLDFALWKFAKPGEPKWAFEPYGDGRPGWHIECSAMSHAILDPDGLGFDIHGGGADLIFPHHENEIAQSEPLMAHPPMANLWIHGGLLNFDGRKMSKSLGNFEPLSALLERHDPQAIRLAFLTTGYRKVMNLTEDSTENAYTTLDRLKKAYRALAASGDPVETDLRRTGLVQRIDNALADDMNTAVALADLIEFSSTCHPEQRREAPLTFSPQQALHEYTYALRLLGIEPNQSWLEEPHIELPPNFVEQLNAVLENVSVKRPPQTVAATGELLSPTELIERTIEARNAARAAKDWATSDALRDALAKCGVALKDSKDGTTWSIVRTAE
jgi:cysteinyl-tRNA synthetase